MGWESWDMMLEILPPYTPSFRRHLPAHVCLSVCLFVCHVYVWQPTNLNETSGRSFSAVLSQGFSLIFFKCDTSFYWATIPLPKQSVNTLCLAPSGWSWKLSLASASSSSSIAQVRLLMNKLRPQEQILVPCSIYNFFDLSRSPISRSAVF